MSDIEIMVEERKRIAFVCDRDGGDGAVAFAKRALGAYRACVRRKSNGRRSGYGSAYRRSLVLSCIVFREFIRAERRPQQRLANPLN